MNSRKSLTGGSTQIRSRLVKKNGQCNVKFTNMRRKNLADIFTTCVELRWRYLLLLFCTVSTGTWVFFGIIYHAVSVAHGDLQPHVGKNVCIRNVEGFLGALMFSMETQTTIGYGYRSVTERCPVSVVTVLVQSLFGCIVDTFMIGTIMAKMTRPQKRNHSLMFSKNAVVLVRDGKMCLMWRVGNVRRSRIVGATVRAQFVRSYVTAEGEFIPMKQEELNVGLDKGTDRLFLVSPLLIVHEIDKTSPLFSMSGADLLTDDFEIVVIVEGIVEATAITTQFRSSYLASEILWGHRFEPVLYEAQGYYNVDYSRFHETREILSMPRVSAKALGEAAGQRVPTSTIYYENEVVQGGGE